jgi:hypothetical protein
MLANAIYYQLLSDIAAAKTIYSLCEIARRTTAAAGMLSKLQLDIINNASAARIQIISAAAENE